MKLSTIRVDTKITKNRDFCIYTGLKVKFEFGSTCATRCKFLGAQLKILGAQLIMLGASISKEKVKSLTVLVTFTSVL